MFDQTINRTLVAGGFGGHKAGPACFYINQNKGIGVIPSALAAGRLGFAFHPDQNATAFLHSCWSHIRFTPKKEYALSTPAA